MNKSKKFIFIFLSSLVLFFGLAGLAVAQVDTGLGAVQNGIQLSAEDPRVIAARIIQIALGFLGIIAVALIVYAGFLWMTSGGDEEKITKAKKLLTSGVIGLIIILSAFGIASFILNGLTQATGVNDTGDSNNGYGSCSPACSAGTYCCYGSCISNSQSCSTSGGASFYVKATTPNDGSGDNPRNTRVKVVLNKSLTSAITDLSNEHLAIKKVAAIDPETGVETATDQVITGGLALSENRREMIFQSEAGCADERQTENCLPEWSKFVVTVNQSLRSDDNSTISPIGTTFTFSTGDLSDTMSPEVGITSAQICRSRESVIKTWGKDDLNIASYKLYGNKAGEAETIVNEESSVGKSHSYNHIFDSSSALVGDKYIFKVTAEDGAGSKGEDSLDVEIRADHCCNGKKDADEVDVDCGGADCLSCAGGKCNKTEPNVCGATSSNCTDSKCITNYCACKAEGCICDYKPTIEVVTPVGGFCENDSNKACFANEDCSPSKCDMTTANGSKGSIVAVRGKWFGEYVSGKSKISFSNNGTTWIDGLAPSSINPDCDNTWTNSQIVTVVPNGLSIGSAIIRITSGNEQSDTTQDDRGRKIDFRIIGLSRPGICKVDPASGKINATLNYYGLGVQGATAYFGTIGAYFEAKNSSFTVSKQGTAKVPGIRAGETTTFVMNEGKVASNYLAFTKEEEPSPAPYIGSFEPKEGPIGQYVTITGGNFGGSKGVSEVYFVKDASEIKASFDFPKVCADSVWSDNQIIVKVPTGLTDGSNYKIKIKVSTYSVDSGSETFKLNNTKPLAPSLCRIAPVIGQPTDPLSLWGEYFGDKTAGKVVFNETLEQGGSWGTDFESNSFWGKDPKDSKASLIKTIIHADAATGQVAVKQGANIGNGINLEIGLCTDAPNPSEACGAGEYCCAKGTIEEGKCKATEAECNPGAPDSSVFQWSFSTREATSTNSGSCSSLVAGQCSVFCPNVPGQCSPYAGNNPVVVGTCVNSCEGVKASGKTSGCTADTCDYDSSIDRCKKVGTDATCGIYKKFTDINNVEVKGYCAFYAGSPRWHIKTNLSCPSGWNRLADNKTCAYTDGPTCGLCSSDFICFDNNQAENEATGEKSGICVIEKDICPKNATCASDDKCKENDKSQCQCCCRVGQDEADCCPGLDCLGTCGQGETEVGTKLGFCSGCRVESDGAVDQNASNLACNCSGHTGQYCDVNADPNGDETKEGVCRDCGTLNLDECRAQSSVCCADAKAGNQCRGLKTGTTATTDGYCPYFSCDNCNVSVKDGDYELNSQCNDKCKVSNPPTGEICYNPKIDATTCYTSFCNPFSCLDESGNSAFVEDEVEDTCGRCCCDPNFASKGQTDECVKYGLFCAPNQSPCTSETNDRGLCCGCKSDSQCGADGLSGCGNDTCCRARPVVDVEATSPIDGADKVCRNLAIEITFSQVMDNQSLDGNIILLAEYDGTCPSEYPYLTKEVKKGFFKKAYGLAKAGLISAVDFIFGNDEAVASNPEANKNYCIVAGTASIETDGANDLQKTVVTFSPKKVLAPGKKHYVVVVGDKDLNSLNGVLSEYGIGMKGRDPLITINGKEYKNAEAWSFTTLPDQGPGKSGICEVDKVQITPSSYLIKTQQYDPNEDDNSFLAQSFDKKSDNDKVFTAKAISRDNQVLTPIDGLADYYWDWVWTIQNTNIIEGITTVSGLPTNKKLYRAKEDISDGYTSISAKADFATDSKDRTGLADVYVFICNNPWPAINYDPNTWSPWEPTDCGQYCHFKLYYCRDNQSEATFDDLPALVPPSSILKTKANTDPEMKVEYYLFRQELPTTNLANLNVVSLQAGGGASVTWSNVGYRYRIYWRTEKGEYVSKDVGAYPTQPHVITDLKNNTKYYFNLTSYDISGAESEFYGERMVEIKDTVGPAGPTLDITPDDGKVSVGWEAAAGVVSNKLFYKTMSISDLGRLCVGTGLGINFGQSEAVASNPKIVSSLANGTGYCFAMVSYDRDLNTGTTTMPAIPIAPVTDLAVASTSDEEVTLSWTPAGGADSYNIYIKSPTDSDFRLIASPSINNCAVNAGKKCAAITTGLVNGMVYQFKIYSVNASGVPSGTVSNIVSGTPKFN